MVHFPSSFVYLNGFPTPMEVFFPWHILMDLPQVAPAFVGHLANPLGLDTVEFQPDVDSWCVPRVTETWENQVMLFQLPRKQNRIITIPFFFGEKKRWSSQTPKMKLSKNPAHLLDLVGIYANVSYEISKSCWGKRYPCIPDYLLVQRFSSFVPPPATSHKSWSSQDRKGKNILNL